jgi:hypothetical protein
MAHGATPNTLRPEVLDIDARITQTSTIVDDELTAFVPARSPHD